MESNIVIENKRNRIAPQKFALWAAMASIMMMFGAFTSAYLVKQAAGNWLEYSFPSHFYISTAVILLSSFTLYTSFRSFKNQQEKTYKYMLIVSLLLGIAFVILQYMGWMELFSRGIDLKGNVSGSFFYLISGVHAIHVLGGIAAIIVALIHAYSLKFNVTLKRINRFDLTINYWHFVDVLWVYLFIFLLVSK